MGNQATVALYNLGEGHCGKSGLCCVSPMQNCYSGGVGLDHAEFAIHQEVGIPRGRLLSDALKYLDNNEIQLMYAAAGNNVSAVR